MPKNEEVPAWLLCEDILNKIKSELITQAMDTLDEAVSAKVIDIKGNLITLPDKPGDTEMKMFVINRLVGECDRIMEMYKSDSEGSESDPARLEQKERMEKFLLYVQKICMLMDYSKIFDGWINDCGEMANERDAGKIISATLSKEHRREVLEYVMKNKTIIKEEILTEEERRILQRSIG